MTLFLLIFSAIVVTCIFFNRFSGKVGIPVLLFFLMLGLLCGSQNDGFASQWAWIVGKISTIALIFIMFYGGFGTRWKSLLLHRYSLHSQSCRDRSGYRFKGYNG